MRGGRLQPRDLGVGLGHGRGALGDEVAQRAGLHALLAEARQHVGDVGEVGLVRPDEEHAAAAVPEPRVGVEEVRRAVQRDDGLAGARTAVDDEGAARAGADDGVLVGLDRAEHVAHPRRPAAAEAGDERRLVVERGVPLEAVGGEHLVPVVGDPAAGPAVAAAAREPHRVGVGGAEERLGRGGAPVDEQPATGARRSGRAGRRTRARCRRRRRCGPRHRSRLKRRSVRRRAVSRWTSRSRSIASWPVPPGALRATSRRSVRSAIDCSRLSRDRGEVQLVGGDQRRVGLGGEVVGQVERTARQAGHVDQLQSARVAGIGDSAARRGACRKTRGALYLGKGEGMLGQRT